VGQPGTASAGGEAGVVGRGSILPGPSALDRAGQDECLFVSFPRLAQVVAIDALGRRPGGGGGHPGGSRISGEFAPFPRGFLGKAGTGKGLMGWEAQADRG